MNFDFYPESRRVSVNKHINRFIIVPRIYHREMIAVITSVCNWFGGYLTTNVNSYGAWKSNIVPVNLTGPFDRPADSTIPREFFCPNLFDKTSNL